MYVNQQNCGHYFFGNIIESILHSFEHTHAPEDLGGDQCIIWDYMSVHKIAYFTHVIHGQH